MIIKDKDFATFKLDMLRPSYKALTRIINSDNMTLEKLDTQLKYATTKLQRALACVHSLRHDELEQRVINEFQNNRI